MTPEPPTTSDPPRPVALRLAGLLSAAVAAMSAVIAVSMLPENAEWLRGWLGLAAVYGVAAVGLWRGRPWARWYALGMALWGLVAFVESAVVVGPLPFFAAGGVVHLLLVGALIFARSAPAAPRGRLAFAMVASGAAVPCAALYALAPQQTLAVTLGVLGGALVLAAGTWGICRGRTWGLFAALGGAALVVLTITRGAAVLGWLRHEHFLLPSSNPLALQALGIAAASLAVLAVIPFLWPMARFVLRGR
jgi:hypothetical protein